jgi:hypothetical protein
VREPTDEYAGGWDGYLHEWGVLHYGPPPTRRRGYRAQTPTRPFIWVGKQNRVERDYSRQFWKRDRVLGKRTIRF